MTVDRDAYARVLQRRDKPRCSCDLCIVIPAIRPCTARDLVIHVTKLEDEVQKLLTAKSQEEVLGCIAALRILINEA